MFTVPPISKLLACGDMGENASTQQMQVMKSAVPVDASFSGELRNVVSSACDSVKHRLCTYHSDSDLSHTIHVALFCHVF